MKTEDEKERGSKRLREENDHVPDEMLNFFVLFPIFSLFQEKKTGIMNHILDQKYDLVRKPRTPKFQIGQFP